MIPTIRSSNIVQSKAQVELLRKISIFEHLGDDTLLGLARRMTVKRWHASAIIIGQGESGDALHVVFRGQAKSVLFGESGREMTLGVLKAGDFFGETALLDGRPAPANVVAIDDCVTLVLDRRVFLDHLRDRPESMMRMLAALAGQLRHANELIGNLALHDVVSRLTRTLIAIGDEHGEYRDDGVLIRYRPTQQDLANMVGTCRETVSRALSAMGRRGLVVSRGRSLLLRHELIEGVRAAA